MDPAALARFRKVLGLLGSAHDGERAANTDTWCPIGEVVQPVIKTLIVSSALAGTISADEAERRIRELGLREA